MLLFCTECKYMFESEREVSQCPDCGKVAVRSASPSETQEYEQRKMVKDDWFEQKPPSFAELENYQKEWKRRVQQ